MATKYIVVLTEGTSHPVRDAVIEHVKSLGATVTNVYAIFPGFAADVPDGIFAQFNTFVTQHPSFSSIEADGVVHAL